MQRIRFWYQKTILYNKDEKLKERKLKIKKKQKNFFFKPIIMSVGDIDRFEQKEMKNNRLIKNTWYWLINFIPEPIRKTTWF